VLANIAIDFVVGQPSFFERTGECGQSLCGVPSGATPSLKPETWRAVGHTSRDRRLLSTISPVATFRQCVPVQVRLSIQRFVLVW
jgi:hypothetical protein